MGPTWGAVWIFVAIPSVRLETDYIRVRRPLENKLHGSTGGLAVASCHSGRHRTEDFTKKMTS